MSQQIKVRKEIISYPGGHLCLNTKDSNRNVRINSQSFSTAASIIGCQIKPRAAVNMTNECIGLEVMPGINSTYTSVGTVCIKAEPYFGSTAGACSGNIRGYEVSLGAPSTVGTQTGGCYGIEFVNNSGKSFTGGIYPIFVNTHGDAVAWSGLMKLPDDGVIANSAEDKSAGTEGWIKVVIGTATRYIPCWG